MKPNKFVIEKQVAAFRMDNGLGASEPVTLKSLLLKLNVLTVFRPLSDSYRECASKTVPDIGSCLSIPTSPWEGSTLP